MNQIRTYEIVIQSVRHRKKKTGNIEKSVSSSTQVSPKNKKFTFSKKMIYLCPHRVYFGKETETL